MNAVRGMVNEQHEDVKTFKKSFFQPVSFWKMLKILLERQECSAHL